MPAGTLAAEPINPGRSALTQILNDRYATSDETGKAPIAADIAKIIAETKSAAEKKLAEATQPRNPRPCGNSTRNAKGKSTGSRSSWTRG